MTRHFTLHWQNRLWTPTVNAEGVPLCWAGGGRFRARRVARGDRVYVVSLRDGLLLLGGRMTVEEIVDRDEAVRRTGNTDLFDVPEWIVGDPSRGTKLHLHRQLAPALTRSLRFVGPKGKTRGLVFEDGSSDRLYGQATRGLQELTNESADLVERILALPNVREPGAAMLTITADMLATVVEA